ncbi:hypothetical protein [Ferruginibacter sp.]
MNKKYFALFTAVLFCSLSAVAQNVSSPYSILGIGDIENNDYGRYNASGGASVSRREGGFYNFSNPASLTVMQYKAINLDFAFRGRVSKFKLQGADTLTAPSKDFVVKRVSLAFKVTPTSAFAFGVRPFSSVNYQFAKGSSINDGNADLYKFTDGSGGINQAYFSYAKQLAKRLSVGATASWLFGALQTTDEYYNALLNLDVTRNENNFYNAAGIQGGLQYYSLPGKKWQHNFGLTATTYTKLKGQNTTNYVESGVTLKTLDPVDISFKMPVTVAAGYSITNINGLSLHLQGTYNKWPTQKVEYKNGFTKDCYGFNAGMEYSKRVIAPGLITEKFYVGWGVKMEQSYLSLNNSRINDYSFSLGGGKNISRFLAASAGIEYGKRGSSSLNQIQENYFQFNVGFTLKDIWFGTRKFGRYN